MKIETEFNIGDEVWYMYDEEAHKAKVVRRSVTLNHDVVILSFFVAHKCKGATTETKISYPFPTKQALLESL